MHACSGEGFALLCIIIVAGTCRRSLPVLGYLVVRMSRKHIYIPAALCIGVATMANKEALFVTLVDHRVSLDPKPVFR